MSAETLQTHRIAIVDGNSRHRAEVGAALLSFYSVVEYPDAAHALAGLKAAPPSVLLVGEQTPPLSGIALIGRLRQEEKLRALPVIYIADRDDPERLAAIQKAAITTHLAKPYRRSALIRAISGLVNFEVEQKWEALPELQKTALKGTVEIFNSISDVIERGEPLAYGSVQTACGPLVKAVGQHDFKSILYGVRDHDNYSYAHSMRVATLLTLFGYTIGLPESEQLTISSGGLLHDVGKMSIPHEVLNKAGALTPEEWAVMKSHVDHSVRYLKATPNIPHAIITIAEQHHEKLDGSGYPHGLKNGELNELARMASIVDVFSALTDRRVYKPPMPAEQALKIMTEDMSHHLDPNLLHMFGQMLLDTAIDSEPALH